VFSFGAVQCLNGLEDEQGGAMDDLLAVLTDRLKEFGLHVDVWERPAGGDVRHHPAGYAEAC
jgi:hypothetical protein